MSLDCLISGACISEKRCCNVSDFRCCESGGTVQDDHTAACQANRRPEIASENQKTQAR